jgi:ubiquinone/menaquinone biosynthesis C-methylase UbiE
MERYLTPDEKQAIRRLYEDRYAETGRHVKTVGWGSTADQMLRFEMLFRGLDARGKRILDVGCGLGDLVPFLDRLTGGDYDYTGTDLSPTLIDDARSTFGGPQREFTAGDILELRDLPEADIVVLSGALNFKIGDNVAHAQAMMRRLFDLSRETAALNYLSSYVDFQLPKNFHHQPATIFDFAKSVTRWVTLYHDYPLWEFTIQMHHHPWTGKDTR